MICLLKRRILMFTFVIINSNDDIKTLKPFQEKIRPFIHADIELHFIGKWLHFSGG